MCEVATAVAVGTALSSVGSSIYENIKASEAEQKNIAAARAAAANSKRLLTLREMQEAGLAEQNVFQIDEQARRADAEAKLMAGESGVEGLSVDLLLNDIDRQRLNAQEQTRRNLAASQAQIDEQKKGIDAQAQAQINSGPHPSWGSAAIRIGGAALDGMTNFNRYKNAGKG